MKQSGKVTYWSTDGGFPAHVWNDWIGDIIIETYVESNVALPNRKVREKSQNSMSSGKWSFCNIVACNICKIHKENNHYDVRVVLAVVSLTLVKMMSDTSTTRCSY